MWQGTVIWDDPDDAEGNIAHIDQHGITADEVLDVLLAKEAADEISESTGLPIVFGPTSLGKYIAVVYEEYDDQTRRPVTAYEVPRPRAKKRRKR